MDLILANLEHKSPCLVCVVTRCLGGAGQPRCVALEWPESGPNQRMAGAITEAAKTNLRR